MGAGGQWAAGEGVVDGAHGFRVVKISSGFRCAHFSIKVSQKIKSAICLSADLSIFLANLSTDFAGAKIRFFVIFCVPENTLNLSACLSIFTFGGSTLCT